MTWATDLQDMVDNPHLPWDVQILTQRAPLELFDAHPDLVIARLVAAEDDIDPPPFVYRKTTLETKQDAYVRHHLEYPRHNTWDGTILCRKTKKAQNDLSTDWYGRTYNTNTLGFMVSTPRRPWNWAAIRVQNASFMFAHPEVPWVQHHVEISVMYEPSLFYKNMGFTWREPYYYKTVIRYDDKRTRVCLPTSVDRKGYTTWRNDTFKYFLSFNEIFQSKYRFTRGDLWKLFKGNRDQFDKFADYLDTHGYDLTADQNQVVDGIKSLMRDVAYTSRQDMVLHRRRNRGGWVDNMRNAPVE